MTVAVDLGRDRGYLLLRGLTNTLDQRNCR